jgi:Holliday junction DNA helicase RuvB
MLMNMALMKWTTAFWQLLLKSLKAGRVGITTIATAVGEEAGTLEEVYEPFLIQEGFIMRTPRGREVTAKAYAHLGKTPPLKGATGSLFGGIV